MEWRLPEICAGAQFHTLAVDAGQGDICRPSRDTSGHACSWRPGSHRRKPWCALLLDPCAATLNQQNQHRDKQDAGDNSNDHDTVHYNSSYFDKMLYLLFRLTRAQVARGAESSRPTRNENRTADLVQPHAST